MRHNQGSRAAGAHLEPPVERQHGAPPGSGGAPPAAWPPRGGAPPAAPPAAAGAWPPPRGGAARQRRLQQQERRHPRRHVGPRAGGRARVAISAGFAFAASHIDFKERESTASLHDLRGSHDSAEVLPAAVDSENVHVAHDVVLIPGLHPIDDVLIIHIAIDDVVLAGRRLHCRAPGQDGVVLAVDLYFFGAHGRVVRRSAFQEIPMA